MEMEKPLAFGKKPKCVVKRKPNPFTVHQQNIKVGCEGVGNSRKKDHINFSADKSLSKTKIPSKRNDSVHPPRKNGGSENNEDKVIKSGHTSPGNDSWSNASDMETRTLLSHGTNPKSKRFSKQKSHLRAAIQTKKDRKLSENVENIARAYEQLKVEHALQGKVMGMALNERELHRLNKIYAVEEAEYMIRIIDYKHA